MKKMKTWLGSLMLVLGFACAAQGNAYAAGDFAPMPSGLTDGSIPTSF